MEKKEIFEKIKAALIEDFDLEEGRIVKLKSFLSKNIDPEAFKKMRTLQNVVDGIYNLVQNSESK